MGYNKIVYDQNVLVDLTGDTVTEGTLFQNIKAHNKNGDIISGNLFSGYPKEVNILIVSHPNKTSKKEKNIVTFNKKKLIDLSIDTVTEDTLLFGYHCHRKDGVIINGKFLENYPGTCTFSDPLKDSTNSPLLDSNGNPIVSTIKYQKSISGNYAKYTKI